jgi:NADH:ubiquinone oxidoreductase subunit
MATFGTRLHTFLHGKHVGTDEYGNKYYTMKRAAEDGRTRRWVVYNGLAEASKVPPLWHAWLHYTTDMLPSEVPVQHYDWEKEHVPNLTGTEGSYLPPGHIKRGADRSPSYSDYQAWTPGEGAP